MKHIYILYYAIQDAGCHFRAKLIIILRFCPFLFPTNMIFFITYCLVLFKIDIDVVIISRLSSPFFNR